MWLPQFHVHSGFYRWCTKLHQKEGPTHTLASVHRLALQKSNLEKKDRLKHEILILEEFKPARPTTKRDIIQKQPVKHNRHHDSLRRID
jgi:hypothetical protein